MPAITVDNPLVLPRLAAPAADAVARPVATVVPAHHAVEGAGFEVWRPFPGGIDTHVADPFFLLDQLGPVEYAPNEPVGAPWHPHRGFETVTYVIDGVIEHHDSNGGGGIIGEGDTQWMTAGAGILHDEVPTEAFLRNGGRSHGVQLWVNLPAAAEVHAAALPGHHPQRPHAAVLARRRRARAAHRRRPRRPCRPGRDPHADHLRPRQRQPRRRSSRSNWNPTFSGLAYVLTGRGYAGRERRPVDAHQLVVFGPGDTIAVGAADSQPEDSPNLEVLLLGGLPIREPIAHYGPFLMNTRAGDHRRHRGLPERPHGDHPRDLSVKLEPPSAPGEHRLLVVGDPFERSLDGDAPELEQHRTGRRVDQVAADRHLHHRPVGLGDRHEPR